MPLLDEQKALAELGVDKAIYYELLGDFVLQIKETIEELHQAISLDDFNQVAGIAHALKGMAGNLRIEEIQTIARHIELGSKSDKNKMAALAGIDKLNKALNELEQLIS